MLKKHSASLEMIAYLKNYAEKRAERKGTDICDTLENLTPITRDQKIEALEKKLEKLQAQKCADMVALADQIAPKIDNNIIIFPFKQAA